MEIIYSYTRAQAIEDGVLVDVSNIARSAGYSCPVALTHSIWADLSQIELLPHQELTDWVLALLLKGKQAARMQGEAAEITFGLVLPRRKDLPKSSLYQVKMVIAPGDNGEPVITLMLPNED